MFPTRVPHRLIWFQVFPAPAHLVQMITCVDHFTIQLISSCSLIKVVLSTRFIWLFSSTYCQSCWSFHMHARESRCLHTSSNTPGLHSLSVEYTPTPTVMIPESALHTSEHTSYFRSTATQVSKVVRIALNLETEKIKNKIIIMIKIIDNKMTQTLTGNDDRFAVQLYLALTSLSCNKFPN